MFCATRQSEALLPTRKVDCSESRNPHNGDLKFNTPRDVSCGTNRRAEGHHPEPSMLVTSNADRAGVDSLRRDEPLRSNPIRGPPSGMAAHKKKRAGSYRTLLMCDSV